MSRQFKKPKIDTGPSRNIQDFKNAVHAYETTFNGSMRRDNRTSFSKVLDTAVRAELISAHDLRLEFDISRDQIALARQGRSADVPKETRDALILHLKAIAAEMS